LIRTRLAMPNGVFWDGADGTVRCSRSGAPIVPVRVQTQRDHGVLYLDCQLRPLIGPLRIVTSFDEIFTCVVDATQWRTVFQVAVS